MISDFLRGALSMNRAGDVLPNHESLCQHGSGLDFGGALCWTGDKASTEQIPSTTKNLISMRKRSVEEP